MRSVKSIRSFRGYVEIFLSMQKKSTWSHVNKIAKYHTLPLKHYVKRAPFFSYHYSNNMVISELWLFCFRVTTCFILCIDEETSIPSRSYAWNISFSARQCWFIFTYNLDHKPLLYSFTGKKIMIIISSIDVYLVKIPNDQTYWNDL